MGNASITLVQAAFRACLAALSLAAAIALGGCASSSGSTSGAFAMASPTEGASIAFESIDGPPPQVFERMVSVLDSESKLRSLAIVSREGSAAYRVRAYLSAQVVHGKTMIAWVWDVYDRDQQRAMRLTGEEAAGKSATRDAWAAADDLVLRKIAQSGLSGLSSMINGTPPDAAPAAPAAPAPARRGPAVASVDTPGANGLGSTALGYTDR